MNVYIRKCMHGTTAQGQHTMKKEERKAVLSYLKRTWNEPR